MPINNIQSYNTMQLQQQNTRTNLSERGAVIVVSILLGLSILFGAKILGMDISNSKVTGLFKKGAADVDPTTGLPLGAGGATPQLADLNDTAAADAAAAASGTGSTSSKPASGGKKTSSTPTPAPAVTPTPTPTPAPAASACGNPVIPAEACTSILSIESSGPKTSPYMLVDVSLLPDGSSVLFDKNTWQDNGDGTAKISFTLTAAGQQQPGWLTFTNENGTWNATDYE